MATPESPIRSLELRHYGNKYKIYFIGSMVPAFLFCMVFFLTSGDSTFLIPLPVICGVGALNYYLLYSRPIPKSVKLSEEGISFKTKTGRTYTFPWSDVAQIREEVTGMRHTCRMEVHFKNQSEILFLYRAAMKIAMRNDRPYEKGISDYLLLSTTVWDRPLRLTRQLFEQKIPGFKA